MSSDLKTRCSWFVQVSSIPAFSTGSPDWLGWWWWFWGGWVRGQKSWPSLIFSPFSSTLKFSGNRPRSVISVCFFFFGLTTLLFLIPQIKVYCMSHNIHLKLSHLPLECCVVWNYGGSKANHATLHWTHRGWGPPVCQAVHNSELNSTAWSCLHGG